MIKQSKRKLMKITTIIAALLWALTTFITGYSVYLYRHSPDSEIEASLLQTFYSVINIAVPLAFAVFFFTLFVRQLKKGATTTTQNN
ncbi:hypothetical protein [Pseudidiomarina sp. CB1]|uniref:hypothetical protein n=1 Tax=Pseudidiomarina sp. CB1 TaxID=2972484 RepID=UPI0021634C38|nr:hypothetical protein [Pseudidiomarina sp. CB1]